MSHRFAGGAALAAALLVASRAGADARFCTRNDVRLSVDPYAIAIADFYPGNGPDLAITFGNSHQLEFWRNDGTGNFTRADVVAQGPAGVASELSVDPAAIIAADFDGDGDADVAGTNRNSKYFAFLNRGPGAWGAPAAADAQRGFGNDLAAVNWNGDRALDLVFAQDAGGVAIALGATDASGNPLGTWGITQRFTTTAPVGVFTDVEVANFIDIAPESGTSDLLSVDNQLGQLVIWPGNPAIPGQVLTSPSSLVLVPVTDAGGNRLQPLEAELGDWNGDTRPDVFVTTMEGIGLYYQGNGLSTVFDAPVRQDFVAPLGIGGRLPTSWSAVVYADVVGDDGIRDLVVADAGQNTAERGFNWLTIIPGTADAPSAPQFDVANQTHYAMATIASLRPGSIGVADLDQDGHRDVVVLEGDQSSMTILHNDGAGGFDAPRSFPVGGRLPSAIAAGDFDQNGRDEAAISLVSPGDPALRTVVTMRGTGGPLLAAPTALTPPSLSAPAEIFARSINTAEDSTNDLLVTYASDQALWKGRGDGTFQAPSNASAPGLAAVGQLVGSSDPDIAAVSASTLKIYEGNGRGSFTQRERFDAIYSPRDVAVGDFLGSGGGDVVVSGADALGTTYGLYVVPFNTTTGLHDPPTFVRLEDLGILGDISFLVTAQITPGGNDELVAVASSGEAYVLRTNAGSFEMDMTAGLLDFGGSPRGIVVSDLTNDGVLDIAIADRTSIRIREGQPGGSFAPAVQVSTNIDNSGLAAADLDGDDLPELLAMSAHTNDVTVICNASIGSLVLRVGAPGTHDTLTWSDQNGATFSIATGSLNDLWMTGTFSGATCLASPVLTTTYTDSRALPAPAPPTDRAAYWYLVKCAGADCSEPDFGTTSQGDPRFGPASAGAVPDPCP